MSACAARVATCLTLLTTAARADGPLDEQHADGYYWARGGAMAGALGATIGRGVWCETYWLPETDLVELGDGATVNHGCVVQTHLFHDRVLALGPVRLRRGATLGPNSVILPAATIGRHATIGPASLVMRGEEVPSRTRWLGNPIGPWEQ